METVWFTIIALMLATYVVLDGFDFGAGILHLIVAKTDEERRMVLGAIGPVWDGNEVWLLASGGVLVYAFPRAYAAGFSGFYMPLMMALWLLILRGVSIEFRNHHQNPLWRSLWDGLFWFSSTLMAIILGAALGNIIRGVPLESSGYFSGPLFTDFRVGPHPGVLDWYTVLVGVFTLSVLAAHGAVYLLWKTTGEVHARSRRLAKVLWSAVVVLVIPTTIATAQVRPELYQNLFTRTWTWAIAAMVLGGLILVFIALKQKEELKAFLASCGFLAGMLGATLAGLYPNLLLSTIDPAYTVNVHNAVAGEMSLRVGLIWWMLAILLAIGYFSYVFYLFRGKVQVEDGYGH
jgi:cytochrome d ubiquinol oxidase subunit II